MTDKPRVVNIGLADFAAGPAGSGAVCLDVEWRPPGQGDPELADILFRLAADFPDRDGRSRIESANRRALDRVLAARPVLRRIAPARDLLPGLDEDTLLHAGPPIAWADMCAPMRGAVLGAVRYERRARSDAEAAALLDAGDIRCRATHEFGVVAPMAGIVSPSMPLLEVENAAFGNRAFAPLNEGVGYVLRFGANNPPVLARLRWLEETLAPALDAAVRRTGGVELKRIMAKALLMGDEMHQRNIAASLLFYQDVATALLDAAPELSLPAGALPAIVSFLSRDNEQFFLNLAMAAAKSALDPARGIPYCSMATCMSRNGVDFGLMVSALDGRWMTAPSMLPRGLYFPGFGEDDANPDMGDSAIMECYGLGGFAMAASPTVARFLGARDPAEAAGFSIDMEHICIGANPDFCLPGLNFAGAPTGIDITQIVATGILPAINSGVAHRLAGVGQVGAGLATPPMEAVAEALRCFYRALTEAEAGDGGA